MDANVSIDAWAASALLVPWRSRPAAMLAASPCWPPRWRRWTGPADRPSAWSWSPAPPAPCAAWLLAACGLSLVVAAPATHSRRVGRHPGPVTTDGPRQHGGGAGPVRRHSTGCGCPTCPVSDRARRRRVELRGHRARPGRSWYDPATASGTLARELVGPAAEASDVASAARALYRANRRRIGPDPNLIFPGTQLDPPGGAAMTTPHPPNAMPDPAAARRRRALVARSRRATGAAATPRARSP